MPDDLKVMSLDEVEQYFAGNGFMGESERTRIIKDYLEEVSFDYWELGKNVNTRIIND